MGEPNPLQELARTLNSRIVDAQLKLDHHGEYREFARAVVAAASEFFAVAGLAEDFCVQSGDLDDGVVVFGGTNRLQWSLRHGFRCDESYCTPRFIERYKQIMH